MVVHVFVLIFQTQILTYMNKNKCPNIKQYMQRFSQKQVTIAADMYG